MAKSTQQKAEIAELIRRSEASRLRLSDAHCALKDRLNVPARLVGSLKAEPKKWIGGSVVAGLVASRFFRSKKKASKKYQKEKKSRGLVLGTFALAATMVKPAAKIYATKLLKDYFRNQLESGSAQRPVSRNFPKY